MNLVESLSQIKDFRRGEGMRYQLVPVLLIIIMSIISGNNAYREIAKFAEANKKDFIKFFDKKRSKTPSHVTFREIIKGVNFDEVLLIFEEWASQYIIIEKGEWFSIDGKALGSTVSDYSSGYQNFVSFVSVFSHKRGQVLKVGKLENKKESEIPTVVEIIKIIGFKDIVFTIDALHCQKKL